MRILFGILTKQLKILLNAINLRDCKVIDITLANMSLPNIKYLEFQSRQVIYTFSTLRQLIVNKYR